MEQIQDYKDPPENFWKDNYEESSDLDEPLLDSCTSRRLIKGIDIKDLCDGKDIIFEINDENKERIFEDDEEEISENLGYYDLKSMRERRGAPPLNCSFKEIACKMTNVIENGFIKKQIVTHGIGKTVPEYSYITVHYNLYKENCELPFDSTYLRNRPERFRLGQNEAILGLEYSVKTMKKNENSMFFIKWEYAFGAMGCPDRIGEKCDIVADITLINFVEIDSEHDLSSFSQSDIGKIDFFKCITQVKRLLCNGRDEFAKKDFRASVSSYKKALRILNSLRLADEEQESEMLKHKLKCLVNLAVCYNQLSKYEQACVMCQEALSIDNKNIKAYFHYGRANVALSNFSTALRYLKRANSLKPNDKDINLEIKRLNDKKAVYEAKDKIFWKKAFEGEEDAKEKGNSPLQTFEKTLITSLENL